MEVISGRPIGPRACSFWLEIPISAPNPNSPPSTNREEAFTSTTAASGHTAAWLGEVVVHGQDIRRPLGLPTTPTTAAATAVADFYASRDFTVPSRTTIAGLRLDATDGPFATGAGPLVTGPTIALVMVMAGRSTYADDLTGPGLPTLRARLAEKP